MFKESKDGISDSIPAWTLASQGKNMSIMGVPCTNCPHIECAEQD
jgi:hypothetical protein